MQTLCKTAPVVARFLAEEIPKHLGDGDGKEIGDPEVSTALLRKRTRTADPTYRPPKSCRAGKVPAQGDPPNSGGSVPERGQGTPPPMALPPAKTAGEPDPGLSRKGLQDLGPPSPAQDGLAVQVRDTKLLTHELEPACLLRRAFGFGFQCRIEAGIGFRLVRYRDAAGCSWYGAR